MIKKERLLQKKIEKKREYIRNCGMHVLTEHWFGMLIVLQIHDWIIPFSLNIDPGAHSEPESSDEKGGWPNLKLCNDFTKVMDGPRAFALHMQLDNFPIRDC